MVRANVFKVLFLVLSLGIGLLFVSVVGAAAESLASVSEATRVSPNNRHQSDVELPGGMDPMEVVRIVERNRKGDIREASAGIALRAGSPSEVDETSRPRYSGMEGQVGPAFEIGGPSAQPSNQYDACVAFGGTNYLVVWMDHRSGVSSDIYGARVSPDGAVLDSSGIAISTATDSQQWPAIAFDGTDYLVVWEDYRSGVSSDIYGARVSASGTVLDPAGITISTTTDSQRSPAVAFDGTNYLVVWTDDRNSLGTDIYGARVARSGAVLDHTGIAISVADGFQSAPAIAFGGTNYLVVWEDWRSGPNADIYGARVGTGGGVLDPAGKAICGLAADQRFPAVAFGGTNYLVVWTDYRNGADADTYGARVSMEGSVVDGAGIAISTATDYQEFPAVAFDGTNYFVTWRDWRDGAGVRGARVDVTGGVLDPMGIIVSTESSWLPYFDETADMAFDGTNYLVVWNCYRSGIDYDIYGTRVRVDGVVTDPKGIPVSTGAVGTEYCPDVAFDGMNYLVVWEDYRSGSNWDVYGARVDVAGHVLDPAGIAISTAANSERSPAVAFGETNYLVVWQDNRSGSNYDIYGARVNVSGSVVDVSGIAISTAANDQMTPAIAFQGTNYLAAWTDMRSGSDTDIYGSRVSTGGTVLDASGIAISTAASYQTNPAIAFGAIRYLVVWQDYRGGNYDIYGARVTAGGGVLDGSGIPICADGAIQQDPDVAFDGTNFLVVWDDGRNGSQLDIYGARVGAGGVVLDASGIAVSTDAHDQLTPAVAFDGTDYGVTWVDYRNASWDIYGARVSTGGVALDPGGVAISTAAGSQDAPCVSMGPAGQLLIGYISPAAGGCSCDLIWGNLWGEYVGVEKPTETPGAFGMCQSYPNPFNPICTVRYDIARAGKASLRVFDVSGSLVRTLVDAWREPGTYSEVWDGRDENGRQLASGVYLMRLEAGQIAATGKAVLLR